MLLLVPCIYVICTMMLTWLNGSIDSEFHFVAKGCSFLQNPQLKIWSQWESCPCIFYTAHLYITLHAHIEHTTLFSHRTPSKNHIPVLVAMKTRVVLECDL